jgi:hypothetical protein
MGKVNRNFKAGVFMDLFGEPEKELELYNAFSRVQYPPDTPVIDLTLADALYMDRINDLSFSIGGKLVVFFEHQASINVNMPLRFVLYYGRVLEKLFDTSEMYSEKRVTIPTPEFYVLYNGIKPFPDKTVYRLSDSFAQPESGELSLELEATVYNINKGYNEEIVKRSKHLHGYVTFVAMVRVNEESGMERSMAVEKAIKECIELGILAEYLKSNASEVSNMLLQEWNWEDAKAVWQREAKKDGIRLGEERGIRRGEERGEKRSDQKWKSVIAEQNALIAQLQAQLSKSS